MDLPIIIPDKKEETAKETQKHLMYDLVYDRGCRDEIKQAFPLAERGCL